MPRSIELRDEWAGVLAQARTLVDRSEAEKRDLSAEESASWQKAMEDMKALEARVKRQEYLEQNPVEGDEERAIWDRVRDGAAGPPNSEKEATERGYRRYREASRNYMLRGPYEISQEDRDLLRKPEYRKDPETGEITRFGPNAIQFRQQEVQNLATGGFWVADEMQQRVEKAMAWFGGMRAVADVITTDTGGDLPWPVYDDTGNTGRLLTEGAATTQTDLAVGVRMMKAFTYSSDRVLISLQLLQDAPLMSENLVADALGERIGRITNTHFTSYDVANGPQGLIRGTTAGLTAGATGAVTADELQRLQFAVNIVYRIPSALYMCHDNSYRDALQLKDGEGGYLFLPDPRGGLNDVSIWGRRVQINNDMPTMATGNIAWEFGDFRHYKIRDVRGFTLLRLNELYAANLQVGFIGFSRHDGGYINAGQNPIQHIVMA